MYEATIIITDEEGVVTEFKSQKSNEIDVIRDVFKKLHEDVFFTDKMPALLEIDTSDASFIENCVDEACRQGTPYFDADSFREACKIGQVGDSLIGYGPWVWDALQSAENTLVVVKIEEKK